MVTGNCCPLYSLYFIFYLFCNCNDKKINKRTYSLTVTNSYHIDFTYYLTVTETVTNRYLKFDPYCCSSKGQDNQTKGMK